MQPSLKISTLKLLLVNLIPVIGVVFFDWELFEIAIIYILETICIFLVFDIDHYFIDERTRVPYLFALMQFFFTLVTVLALMYGSALMIFSIITPPMDNTNAFTELFAYKLGRMNLVLPFLSLFILELITYYIRKSKDTNHSTNSTWRVMRRILYSHLYIGAALLILTAFPQNLVIFIPFFMGLKIVLEYSTEDERIFKALWRKFMETRIAKYFQVDAEQKNGPEGYLSKKRTYMFRKRIK